MKSIPGFEQYFVNTYGQVFKQVKNEKIMLKPEVHRGYLRVCVNLDGKRKHHKVHRLVAKTYLNNFDEELAVNHKDSNKLNNHISNLEMCTPSFNYKHYIESLKERVSGDKIEHIQKSHFILIQKLAIAHGLKESDVRAIINNIVKIK